MRTATALWVLAATLAPALSPFQTPALADPLDKVMQLDFTQAELEKGAPESGLTVMGSGGRYDRIAGAGVSLRLSLRGQPGPDAASTKILKSELALKTEGAGSVVDTMNSVVPQDAIEQQQSWTFAISPSGPVAQAAIAACNGLTPAERPNGASQTVTLSLAVAWRVTSGRFNFKWTNYDRVAPSDEIINNRDFYADQQVTVAEAAVPAAVVCQPLNDAPAVAKAPAQAVVQSANLAPAVEAAPVKPTAAKHVEKPIEAAPVAAPPVKTASIDVEKAKPQCDGGMVRQLSDGANNYLCLCPGNTERIATGQNAFACEKRSRRR